MDISFVQLDKEDIVLLVKGVISFLSITIVILGWYIHRQTERIKVMENLISEKKNEAYSSFVGLFYDLLKQSKENKSLDTHDGLEKMMEIKKTLFMYGSDRVFKAMNEWLKYCNRQYDQKEMLNKVLKLLVLIRKDLQNNSKLKVDDILLNIMQSEEEVKKFKSLSDNSGKLVPSVAHAGTARSASLVPFVDDEPPKA